MDPSLWELYEAGDDGDEVAAIIRVSQPGVVPKGIRLVAQFGDIATCRIRRGALLDVRANADVTSLKAPRLLIPEDEVEPHLPIEVFEERYSWSDQRRPVDLPYDGQGVVVAVVDWGFDFAHPEFRNEDGTTRLLALWDQRGHPGAANPYGYGAIHTQEVINRALLAPDPYEALGYRPFEADSGHGAHGTHVLSIAAGNGQGDGPVGVAPKADLICVHMSSITQQRSARLGDSASLLEAIDFITKLAATLPPLNTAHYPSDKPTTGRPFVINLSMGRHGQPHDGTTLVEQGLDALVRENPGRAIVQSAGNYHERCIHASGQLRPTEARSLIWQVHEADLVPNEMEIWYSGRDVMQVEVRTPDGALVAQADLGERASIVVDGVQVGNLYNRAREPNSLDNQAQIFLYRSAPAGNWEVVVRAENIVDGRYHCWIEREPTRPGKQSRFRLEDAEPAYTTGTICNGFRTIAVGAYNSHASDVEIASFSSAGPTRDGRIKPDLCAPGVYVLAARSATKEGNAPLHTRMSGTSMASPHVAGAIALMFEASVQPLRIEDTRNLLLASAQKITDSGDLLNRVGSGFLNIRQAIEAVKHISPISPVARQPIMVTTMKKTEASEPSSDQDAKRDIFELMEQAEIMENLDMDAARNNLETSSAATEEALTGVYTSDVEADHVADIFDTAPGEWETPDHIISAEFAALMGIDGNAAFSGKTFEADGHRYNETFIEPDNRLVEIADTVVRERGTGRSSRLFLHEVLSRAGVTDSLRTVDPARIFDAFVYARDNALLANLENIFECVGFPLSRLTRPLKDGDILIRRGDSGFAHVALIARPEISSLRRLDELGLTPELRIPGNYTHVVEGGAKPHSLSANFARRITEPSNHLPYDQLILRVQMHQAQMRAIASEQWEWDEAVNRNSTEYARWIQTSLNQLIQAGLKVDGIIGSRTRETTRTFQRQHPGLVVDGIVGSRTEAAMVAAGAPPPPGADVPVIPVPPVTPPIVPPVTPTLATSLNPTRWGPILRPRISPSAVMRTGNGVKFSIDGPDTFRDFVHAIRTANSPQHYIYLLGWALVDDFELIPCDPTTTPRALLTAAAARGVQIRVMLWSTRPGNLFPSRNINSLATGASILDGRFPGTVGAHHQKVLVVKGHEGLIGFCGGLDMNSDRINACPSSRSSVAAPNPQHDVHCKVVGPAAFDLLQTFIRRWDHHPDHVSIDASRGALLGHLEPVPTPVSSLANRTSTGRSSTVVIARTFNPVTSGTTLPRERDIRTLLIEAIRNSERFIYMEDQYLIHPEAARELRARIPSLQHLTILTTASEILAGLGGLGGGGLPCVWMLRQEFIRTLTTGLSPADQAKIGIFVLTTPPVRRPPVFGSHTYVHAKTWVFDDELAVIGSANCNRRGWTHDSEVNAFVFDEVSGASMPLSATPNFAQALRMQLWAEHLNVAPAVVMDGVASANLWRIPPPGARIMAYNPTAGSDSFLLNCSSTTTRNVIDPEIP